MAATDYYVTTTGATTKDGLTWATAFDHPAFLTDLTGSQEAGDRYFIKEGAYSTLTGNETATAVGTAIAPCEIIGVVSATSAEPPTPSDWAAGDNRPLFQCAAYYYAFLNYFKVCNIRFTGTGVYIYLSDQHNIIYNCSANNSSGTASRFAHRANDSYAQIVGCDGTSANGYALAVSSYGHASFCYLHDSTVGVLAGPTFSFSLVQCFIDTCTTGIDIDAKYVASIISNTIYNCTTGITGTTAYTCVFVNNIIDACTTGATWTTSNIKNNLWANNFFDSDGTPRNNVDEGHNEQSAASSGMNDPGADPPDISITAADTNVANKGLDVGYISTVVVDA